MECLDYDFGGTADHALCLKLFSCKITNRPFANILRYCSNLRTLEFNFEDLEIAGDLFQVTSLNKIIPDNLQNKSLRTLKIQFTTHIMPYSFEWLRILRQIFHFFPNISEFSFRHLDVYGSECPYRRSTVNERISLRWDESEEHNEFEVSLDSFFNRDQLKDIALDFLYYPLLLWDSLATNIEGLTK